MTYSSYSAIQSAYNTPFNANLLFELPRRAYIAQESRASWSILEYNGLEYGIVHSPYPHLVFSAPKESDIEHICDLVSKAKTDYVSISSMNGLAGHISKLGLAISAFMIYDNWGSTSPMMFYGGLGLLIASAGILLSKLFNPKEFKELDHVNLRPQLAISRPKVIMRQVSIKE